MATKKLEIIASAMLILPLLVLFFIDLMLAEPTCLFDYVNIMTAKRFVISTVVCTIIYLAIFSLHIKRVHTRRWKCLIAAISVVLLLIILPMRSYLVPERWDFEYRLLFAIDFIAIVAFLLLNFIPDATNTTLVTLFFSTPLTLLYVGLSDYCKDVYDYTNSITTLGALGIVYFLLLWLYVKHVSDMRWKAMTILVFIFVIGVIALLFHFSFHFFVGLDALYYVLICVDTVIAFVLWVWMYYPKLKELHAGHHRQIYQNTVIQLAGGPTRFTLMELDRATKKFETPIGEGGSGTVFKGVRADGSTVAVKRIKGQPSGEQEFENEIRIIASLQHFNLVHLLGYCLSPRGDRYLIYPFFENGSLDSWIFAQEEKRSRLTWKLRYSIAVEMAKALTYLHSGCRQRILHLDVKPANILLDRDFRALLSDFGISKTIGREESSVATRAGGTIGYLPPEMLIPNAISTKSDVYSYGVVLLELVGGRRNFQSIVDEETQQTTNSYFSKIAREKMSEGKIMEIVDMSITNDEEVKEDEVIILVRVALWCIQASPQLRPTMTEVVDMLESRKQVDMPPESQMFVFNFSNLAGGHSREDKEAVSSNNNISISI